MHSFLIKQRNIFLTWLTSKPIQVVIVVFALLNSGRELPIQAGRVPKCNSTTFKVIEGGLKIEDNLKHNDDLKSKNDLKYEDVLKNEDEHKYGDNLKYEDNINWDDNLEYKDGFRYEDDLK